MWQQIFDDALLYQSHEDGSLILSTNTTLLVPPPFQLVIFTFTSLSHEF
jgi:hypothetical protein